MPMIGRAILRLSPIALLVLVAAACGGGGGHTVQARVYLVRNGHVWPVERSVKSRDGADLLKALERGPTTDEATAGFTSAPTGTSRLWLAQAVYTLSQARPRGTVAYHGRTYTRADFEDETPIILVESPLPFTVVKSPLRASGTADTFEGTFAYDLVGAHGKVLGHHYVTATSGTGVRGTFAFTARFTVGKAEPGTLVVYENSAENGRRIHRSEIPLTLEP
jgi:Immunoglobulin-like domain of bacterial spore germination